VKSIVIDFAAYRRTRDLALVVEANLTQDAIARVAFLMTPAPVVFWFMFWAEYATSSKNACSADGQKR
jgi:hypothetical protein